MADTDQDGFRCSFCAKPARLVAKLVAGPDVWICNECVYLCVDILEAEGVERPAPAGPR